MSQYGISTRFNNVFLRYTIPESYGYNSVDGLWSLTYQTSWSLWIISAVMSSNSLYTEIPILINVFIFTDPPIFFEGRNLVLNEKTSWKPLWGSGQVFLMLACDVDVREKSATPTTQPVSKPTPPNSTPTTSPTPLKSILL